MLTVCWAAKGGSGTTVVSCALAMLASGQGEAWLLDAAGDVPAALGMPESSGPGLMEWVSSTTAPVHAIEALGAATASGLRVVPRGSASATSDNRRWRELGEHLAERDTPTTVDAGTGVPPAGLLMAAQRRLLVIRPCYLALRRAAASGLTPTGVIVVGEPGRALRAEDVAAAVQAPVVAELTLDPAVARSVDAGLLLARMPRPLTTALRAVALGTPA